ncbi:MAG: exopolysaccharide Pel transporter PelG, partial [Waddliaceae bacterium]|nr:exopolysaccharide Pel transporter PelG [Waddliaceae bacterium]
RLFIEFPSKRIFDKDLFGFLKNNKILVFTGMFYNIAIWIDKIIFWASPKATAVTGFLRSFHEYEIPIFFAYVTIIPLLSLFLVYVETNFYLRYRTFYDKVLNRGSYAEIGRAKKEVGKSVYDGTKMLVIIQGGLSMLAILYASDIAVMLKLPIIVVPILRISIIGAFLHGMLLTNMIIMLYFDFKVLAFTTTALFMVTNGLFSYLSLSIPLPYLGYNYTAAAFITLIVSFCMVSYKFKKLEYITFALQTLE